MDTVTTKFIVLRKTKYAESSLIISTLSYEYGKLDFIITGASKVNKKKFPIIDLFREIKGTFKLKENGLNKLITSDLIENYDGVASNSESYMASCSIAQFVTANTEPLVPTKLLFSALKNALSKLAKNHTHTPWFTLVKLIFLYEQGLLPGILRDNMSRESEETKQELLGRLLELGCGKDSVIIDSNYWDTFSLWVDQLCVFNNIKI